MKFLVLKIIKVHFYQKKNRATCFVHFLELLGHPQEVWVLRMVKNHENAPNAQLSKWKPAHQPLPWIFLDSAISMPAVPWFSTSSMLEVVIRAVAVLILSAWTSSSSSIGSSGFGRASLLWGEILWTQGNRYAMCFFPLSKMGRELAPGDMTTAPFFQ